MPLARLQPHWGRVVSANLAGAIYFAGTLITITALACSRKAERWAAGMKHGTYRGIDAARRASARYLNRHPNVAAHLDDTEPLEDVDANAA